MDTDAITVLLVEDHSVVREGVRMVLSAHSDIRVVGEAADASSAALAAAELRPTVIVMDLGLPDVEGTAGITRALAASPASRLIVLTVQEDDEYLASALKAGAVGYVPKRAAAIDLVAAVRAVARGDGYIHSSMTQGLIVDYLRHTSGPRHDFDGLTLREVEILKMVAEGRTTQEIAEMLFVSPKTVQAHRANMMAKLDVHNSAALVRYAIHKGLIRI